MPGDNFNAEIFVKVNEASKSQAVREVENTVKAAQDAASKPVSVGVRSTPGSTSTGISTNEIRNALAGQGLSSSEINNIIGSDGGGGGGGGGAGRGGGPFPRPRPPSGPNIFAGGGAFPRPEAPYDPDPTPGGGPFPRPKAPYDPDPTRGGGPFPRPRPPSGGDIYAGGGPFPRPAAPSGPDMARGGGPFPRPKAPDELRREGAHFGGGMGYGFARVVSSMGGGGGMAGGLIRAMLGVVSVPVGLGIAGAAAAGGMFVGAARGLGGTANPALGSQYDRMVADTQGSIGRGFQDALQQMTKDGRDLADTMHRMSPALNLATRGLYNSATGNMRLPIAIADKLIGTVGGASYGAAADPAIGRFLGGGNDMYRSGAQAMLGQSPQEWFHGGSWSQRHPYLSAAGTITGGSAGMVAWLWNMAPPSQPGPPP